MDPRHPTMITNSASPSLLAQLRLVDHDVELITVSLLVPQDEQTDRRDHTAHHGSQYILFVFREKIHSARLDLIAWGLHLPNPLQRGITGSFRVDCPIGVVSSIRSMIQMVVEGRVAIALLRFQPGQ